MSALELRCKFCGTIPTNVVSACDCYTIINVEELADLRTRIEELEADALARLIEEPTNERIMKDVYEENERLQKAVEAADVMFDFISDCGADSPIIRADIDKWRKEYGGKE